MQFFKVVWFLHMFNFLKPFTAIYKNIISVLKASISLIVLLLIVFANFRCTSFHNRIFNASIGMTKRDVLKRFNEPQEKYRTKGQDHWVYETSKKTFNKSQGRITYKHILVFNEGVLINTKFERSFTQKELTEFYSPRSFPP